MFSQEFIDLMNGNAESIAAERLRYFKTRKPLWMEPGKMYVLQNGMSAFRCLRAFDRDAVLQNLTSGWTFLAHGCGVYEDGRIDWDYSTDGHFEKAVNYGTL